MTSFRFTLITAALASLALTAPAALASVVAANAEATRPLEAGGKAPAATLRTVDGRAIELQAALAGKPTVLVFYRGSWCPYCNRQLAAIGELEAKLLALGCQIIAVSPDDAAGLRKATEKSKLNYQLLSDRDMKASAAFRLAFRVPESTAANYTGRGIALAPIPGGDGHWLPVPAVYIIDRSGVIRFAHADPDYKVRLAPADLLAAATAAASAR